MSKAKRLRGAVVVGALVALAAPLACKSEIVPAPRDDAGAAGEAEPATAGSGGVAQGGAPQGGVAGQLEAGAPAEASGGQAAQGGQPAGGRGGSGASGGGVGAAGEPPVVGTDPVMVATSGATQQVHDPAIIKSGSTYYLFSTGIGISVRTSTNLINWKGAGSVFATKPSWITTTDPTNPNHLWAPEVRYFGGKFHLYYSASQFGSKQSCIGHATRGSLSVGSWVDQGEALLCSNSSGNDDDYNAIDPSPFEDQAGNLWLAFGSFWGGIKLVRLNSDGRRNGPDFFSLSTRANNAVEAPHLHYRDGYYYLFESVDACCQGVNSTYKLMVGRASKISGPYLDAAGMALADGGGTLVLTGADRWRGPGHNAILSDAGRDYNVYHSYDADSNGTPTLRIAELSWADDGWPVSAGP